MHKFSFLFVVLLGSFSVLYGQNDDIPSTPGAENPFDQFDQLFEQLELSNSDFFQIDTIITQQFGDMDFQGQDFNESLQKMMEMLTEQFQELNFGDTPGFEHLFEDFNFEVDPFLEQQDQPGTPGEDGEKQKIKKKKKVKTYKL